ncbi:MAG: O-antigen ligase family protein [Cyclobacteriaceae bacterium]|nr:O-antigen ligase family protein [Cyclobacteriaceae bacterium]
MKIPGLIRGVLILCVAVTPISQVLSARLLFAAFVISIFALRKISDFREILHNGWDFLLRILLILIGYTYTDDVTTAFKVLETNFSFLAIPFILYGSRMYHKSDVYRIFYAFILGVATASFMCLIYAIANYFETRDSSVFFYYKFVDVINSHPTYFAYYQITAITFILYLFYFEDLPKGRVFAWNVVLILLFGTFTLTGGRTASISLLFVLSFFLLKFLLDKKSAKRIVAAVSVALMMCGLFVVGFLEIEMPEISVHDYWERSVLWKSAILANPDKIFGVGTGDYKEVLNGYYNSHGMAAFAEDSYNAHNQFIHQYLTGGLLGLIGLTILLSRPLYVSVRRQDALGTMVLFPFILYGITEVFLGRYQGVIFFALFHQLFISFKYEKELGV